MAKLDNEELPPAVRKVQQMMMKKVETENAERIRKAAALRAKNVRTGLTIAGAVLGVYFYTMWAVRQEDIFDDFDKGEKQKA